MRWAETHKVRSFGMWLKLETGMLLMLLLFSVLETEKPKSKSSQHDINDLLDFIWTHQDTHRTSRDRRALNAPSSIQLMWFLSS